MPFTITCPECQTTSPCPDQFAGRKVKCKKCGQGFLAKKPGAVDDLDDADIVDDVEFVDDAEIVEEAPKPKPKSKPPTPPRETPKPAKKKARVPDDDDDDDEDDEDDEPRPNKKRKATAPAAVGPMVYTLMAVVGISLLGGGSTLAYFAIKNDRKEPTKTAEVPPPPGAPGGGMNNGPGPGPMPKVQPPVNDPNTAGWVEKRDATVGYRVKFPVQPQEQTQRVPDRKGGFKNQTINVAVALPEVFIAFGERLPPEALQVDAEAQLDAAVEEVLAGGNAGGDGKMTEKRRSSLKVRGYPARLLECEMMEKGQKIDSLFWIVIANGRVVALAVVGQGITPESPRAKSFTNSLQFD